VSGICRALAHITSKKSAPAHGEGGKNDPVWPYNTATAPVNIASETKHADSTAAVFGRHARSAPDEAPKVATNWAVGFGPPVMVTVGFEGMGLTEVLPAPGLTMENASEVPYMMPCVLLRKRRK